MKKIQIIAALAAGVYLLSPALIAEPDATEKLWTTHCAKCHGKDGTGKTKVGKKLDVADYTDPKVQKTFTDEEALKAIMDGVNDDSGKELMKPYKEKMSEEEAKALIAYIRSMAKPEAE